MEGSFVRCVLQSHRAIKNFWGFFFGRAVARTHLGDISTGQFIQTFFGGGFRKFRKRRYLRISFATYPRPPFRCFCMTEKTAALLYFFQHTYIFPSSLSYIFTFPPPPCAEKRDMSDPQTVPLPFHVFSLCGKPTPPLLLTTVQRTPQLFPPPLFLFCCTVFFFILRLGRTYNTEREG